MFSDAYHPRMRSNRSLQKSLSQYCHVQLGNFDVYINNVYTLLSMCDQCGFKKETKYLIKKLYDTFALKFPLSSPEELQFAAINLLRIGVKFYQDPTQSDKMTIYRCMNQISDKYSRQDFIEFQLNVYKDPEFCMRFTTPYHYFGLYASIFPMSLKEIQKIHVLLDFSFTIHELIFNSAQQIFFGVLLKVFRGKESEKVWILSQTFFQQQSLKISQIIHQIYEEEVQANQNAPFQ